MNKTLVKGDVVCKFVTGPFWILAMQLSDLRSGTNHLQVLGMLLEHVRSHVLRERITRIRPLPSHCFVILLSWLLGVKTEVSEIRGRSVTSLDRKFSLFLNFPYSRVFFGNIWNKLKMATKKKQKTNMSPERLIVIYMWCISVSFW